MSGPLVDFFNMQRPRVSFPPCQDMGTREWGSEELLVHAPGKYTLKRIFIKQGCKGGLQYHHLKDEAAFILSGTLKLLVESRDGELEEKIVSSGEWFHIPALSVHQEIAVTDVIILEVSTPYFNDRVRVEEHFGEPAEGGLLSTTIDQISFS